MTDRIARQTRWLAALLVCAAATTVGQVPPRSLATTPAQHGAVTENTAEESGGKIVLVMDASGSMAEPAAGGTTKIAAAKRALGTVVDGLPAGQRVGLRVYGATVYSEDDPGACTDSQLVVPIAADNRSRLRDAIEKYEPYGETPIGFALAEAGKDLGSSGRRNIILVSDGQPTCRPDPCTVAHRLRADGVDLRIDVVGLDVKRKARRQLACIAEAGGGIYYDARDRKELTESLTRVSERAARAYEAIGEPVDGGTSPGDAPTIGEGDWVDRLESDHPERYYRIERTMDHSTLLVSAAYRSPADSSMNHVSLQTPSGDTCGSAGEIEPFAQGVLVSAGATADPFDYDGEPLDADDPCLSAPALIAVVDYTGPATHVPVEIRVTELPAVDDPASLTDPSGKPHWTRPKSGTTTVTGGTSFADAEPVAAGGYRGTIVPGETLTYEVKVGWGEQLNVRAAVDRLTEATAAVGEGNPSANLAIYGPSRLDAGTGDTANRLLYDTELVNGLSSTDLAQTTAPIAYRRLADTTVAGASQAGTYTITLFLEDTKQNASLPLGYALGVGITGKQTDGPTFTEADTTTPDGPSDTSSDSGDSGDDAGAGGIGNQEASGPASSTADDGGDGISGVSILSGSLGLLALLAAGYLLLRLRRHRTKEVDDET